MLRSVKDLYKHTVQTVDQQTASVSDLYFDPANWEVLYLAVDTGTWLSGRKVIVSLETLEPPLWEEKLLPLKLTQAQLRHSPDIYTGPSLSPSHESQLRTHYNLPPINRLGGGLFNEQTFGMSLDSIVNVVEAEIDKAEAKQHQVNRPDLQSVSQVMGYYIQAQDGQIGHVEDFMVDDTVWMLRYLIIDTGNWLPGRKVLISTAWVEAITWDDSRVHLNLSRESIKNSPEYDPSIPLSRAYEVELHDHYDRTEYWR